MDKDKNRANRAHNREKFLKQLYSDTTKYHRGSAPASTTATMDNTANALAMALGTITPGERSAAETPSPTDHLTGGGMHAGGGAHMDGGASSADWDMSEMFKSIVNVEELTFGINKMGMMPPSSSATVSAINSSTTSPTPDDGHSSSTDPSPTKDVGKLGMLNGWWCILLFL